MNSIPQVTTVQSQRVTDATNQTLNVGNQIYVPNLNQSATKTNASVSNPITSTSQLVSSVIAAQSKLIAKAAASKKIQIQRAGDANRRSPGTKIGNRGQVSTNQVTTNSFNAAQAQANNILSQAISICNLEFDATKSASQVSSGVPSKTTTVSSSQFGSVPTPVPIQTIPSTAAVSVSNVTFSQVIPSVSNTAVTYSQNLISSTANAGSLQTSNLNVHTSYQNLTSLASSLTNVPSSSQNLQNIRTLSSSPLSKPPMSTMVSNTSHAPVKPVVSQIGVKPVVSQFSNVKPVVPQPVVSQFVSVKPGTSQFIDVRSVVSQVNVQPSPVQSTAIIQSAQSNVSMSTAITTLAVSKVTQCPTISSSSTIPISSTSEHNTPAQMQVHLSQQAQIALQKVQAQMKLLLAKKERRPEEDVHLQKLCEVQRKILQHGRQIALKKQEQMQQLGNTLASFASPQTIPTSQVPVTDAKTAIADIQNMHNVPAPNVTILKSGPTPTMTETKTTVVPGVVQVVSQGVQGGNVQTITKVVTNDQMSVSVPTQVKVITGLLDSTCKFGHQVVGHCASFPTMHKGH
jgi:hypothetical protein